MKPDLSPIPKDELAAMTAVARAGGPAVRDTLYQLATLRARKCRKAKRDAAHDHRRRVLVGARLPREEAWLISRAANMEGVSLYQFCRSHLLASARKSAQFSTTNGPFVET